MDRDRKIDRKRNRNREKEGRKNIDDMNRLKTSNNVGTNQMVFTS